VVYEGRPELAVAALLYMLGRFPWTRCPQTTGQILRHLRLIADDSRLDPVFRQVAERLQVEWEAALELPHPIAPVQ
jgi:hypothetical protein